MNRSAALLVIALACAACDREDSSLREGLDALPQDTGTAPMPVEVDTVPQSASAPVLFPEPVDTAPWVPESAEPPAAPSAGPGEWTAGVVAQERPGAPMSTLASVRVARHPEFDRVVLEFSGEELPGYHLEYVDRPVRSCGSGEVVDVQGEGWLAVRLVPSQAHDESGRATLRGRSIRPAVANILDMRMICDFEGHVEWVLGVRSPNQFRVLELSQPARIVVDVES